MKVLVIQNKMIGDVLASTVICREIKRAFPDYIVHYMIQPGTFAVVEHNPFIDKVIYFDPKKVKNIISLIAFGNELKKTGYQIVIDAYGKLESLIPTYLSGAKIRIGFKKSYSALFYTKEIIPQTNVAGSAIHHRLQLAESLTGNLPGTAFPKIYLLEAETAEARSKLQHLKSNGDKIIMISVLGSSSDKSLPLQLMAETLDLIAETPNVKMLFNFIPSQREEALKIYKQCKKSTQEKIDFDFYMHGLRSFLAILSQCDALIGNEGGAVNMAKALNIPTFTIFSPWINKSSWDMLADDLTHVAVHLKDHFPAIYGNRHPKTLKSNSAALYQRLQPELFKSSLKLFLERITK